MGDIVPRRRIVDTATRLKRTWLLLALIGVATSASAQAGEDPSSDPFWLWTLLGRMHPMIVHFPISLLLVAFLIEGIAPKYKQYNFHSAVKLLVVLGAISAMVSVVFGLLLSSSESYGSEVLPLHQWTGIATMSLGILTALAYLKNLHQIKKFLLAVTAVMVIIAGHYGASLTHGEDYLTSVIPGNDNQENEMQFVIPAGSQQGDLTESQIEELNLQVRTVLAHHCYQCHGRAKSKGKLRLDSREAIMKGGEHGVVVVAGDLSGSEIIRRVRLPPSHKDAMPEKGKRLSKAEIDLISYWIKQGAPWPEGKEKSVYRVASLEPRLPQLPKPQGHHDQPIDRFVSEYFSKHDVKWDNPVDDRIFIRRVYLDVVGLLPPPDSIRSFVDAVGSDKRQRLVQQLLSRNDDYAQQWLTFWNDALRNDYSGTGYITGGRSDITAWLYKSLEENKRYNVFVGELISPSTESSGFIKGIKWRGTINASQRTEMQAAQNVAQVFLGLNIKCASCHDSFISDWRLDQAYAFANIFSDSVLEINRCDKPTGRMAERKILYEQLGTIDSTAATADRLKQLADFLVQPADGRLYRTVVNRMWAQVMGRGIVEPVDVMDNEPWSQDLLDWLAYDFAASGYDLKNLLFKILTSDVYQLPSVASEEEALITAPDYVFNGMLRRRLTAEQFIDAVSQVLTPVYPDSLIVFSLLPASVKNHVPFARASLVMNDGFQTALGRPNRETVSTSRPTQANLLQALELTNGSRFNETIQRAARLWVSKYANSNSLIQEIYLQALGRKPLAAEETIAQTTLGQRPTTEHVEDFLWAMALHPEFQLIY